MEIDKSCSTCQLRVDRPPTICDPCLISIEGNIYWRPQAEIVTNTQGGKQSKAEYLWTDFCPKALLRVARLSCAGKEKYGADNWRKITAKEHIDHAVSHLMLWLAKDTSEDHLTHAAWRVLAAMGVEKIE